MGKLENFFLNNVYLHGVIENENHLRHGMNMYKQLEKDRQNQKNIREQKNKDKETSIINRLFK